MIYNPSYPGAGPAQKSIGITIRRWRHQVHPHRPPAPAVSLHTVETSLHLTCFQPQNQKALCKVVHCFKPVARKLGHVEGGGLAVRVEQNALGKRGKENILAQIRCVWF